jgi:hypothetical protein
MKQCCRQIWQERWWSLPVLRPFHKLLTWRKAPPVTNTSTITTTTVAYCNNQMEEGEGAGKSAHLFGSYVPSMRLFSYRYILLHPARSHIHVLLLRANNTLIETEKRETLEWRHSRLIRLGKKQKTKQTQHTYLPGNCWNAVRRHIPAFKRPI